MKAYALFQEYIWLVNIIHRYGRLTLEEINKHWLDTELSEGVPIARSTFNRHRDAILDMFGHDALHRLSGGPRLHIQELPGAQGRGHPLRQINSLKEAL